MKINLFSTNESLISIFTNPEQIITMDANFLIPPDRSRYAKRSFTFSKYKEVWLDPIFATFSNLAIHEAVEEELVTNELKAYIDLLKEEMPPKIIIHSDKNLTEIESLLRNTIEQRIYPYTNYDPEIDNKDDRGEVKSLSYIAVKELPYFAAHDNNALQLVEKAEKWSTGLDNVKAIHMFELIYYLCVKNKGNRKNLKMLYKYQYYLTELEKRTNPEWGQFIDQMNILYKDYID